MRSATRLALGAAALLGVGAIPAAAQDLGLAPCRAEAGLRCGALTVPVDRADPVGGTLTLPVRILPARRPARGTVVLLAGGPGEAALAEGAGFERAVAAAAPDRDVVVLDQRGTGATALRCAALDGETDAGSLAEAAAACAAQIGPTRTRYTTADTVADLDALRTALGAERIALVGVSYGTVVATAYARAHPDRTERLVLDSLAGPEGNSALEPDRYAAARRVLRELCAGGRCRGVTGDPLADVRRLDRRLAVRSVGGYSVDRRGEPTPEFFGGRGEPEALVQALGAGDLSPAARAAFPAAVRAALRGDGALLLRISRAGGTPDDPARFSRALFTATVCQESDLPWTPADAPEVRRAALTAALAAAPQATFAPFRRPGSSTIGALCLGWPESPAAPLPSGPAPAVPTLVLVGSQDLRTPVETARRAAAGIPGARIVVVRGAGHSVLSSGTPCATVAVRRFLAGAAPGAACRGVDVRPQPAPVPPGRLADLAPRGVAGDRGRVLEAVRLTIEDAGRSLELGEAAGRRVRITGLRRGTGEFRRAGGGYVLALDRYAYVPGVEVSGALVVPGRGAPYARVRVGGVHGRGTLVIRAGVAVGRLDGRPVAARLG